MGAFSTLNSKKGSGEGDIQDILCNKRVSQSPSLESLTWFFQEVMKGVIGESNIQPGLESTPLNHELLEDGVSLFLI